RSKGAKDKSCEGKKKKSGAIGSGKPWKHRDPAGKWPIVQNLELLVENVRKLKMLLEMSRNEIKKNEKKNWLSEKRLEWIDIERERVETWDNWSAHTLLYFLQQQPAQVVISSCSTFAQFDFYLFAFTSFIHVNFFATPPTQLKVLYGRYRQTFLLLQLFHGYKNPRCD
ncbi:hypothetical protein PV326_002256, partial [Microctonus aethiopoides]